MPRDVLYLADVVAAAAAIARFLDGVEETRAMNPYVPWKPIIGFRNIAVHAYFSIDWERTWDTATIDVPALVPMIRALQEDLAK